MVVNIIFHPTLLGTTFTFESRSPLLYPNLCILLYSFHIFSYKNKQVLINQVDLSVLMLNVFSRMVMNQIVTFFVLKVRK